MEEEESFVCASSILAEEIQRPHESVYGVVEHLAIIKRHDSGNGLSLRFARSWNYEGRRCPAPGSGH